jgi:hypothetical protein
MARKNIVAFYDSQCPQCGRRIGWYGTLDTPPFCPHCEVQIIAGAVTPQMNRTRQIQAAHVCRQTLRLGDKVLASLEREFLRRMLGRIRRRKELESIQMQNIVRIARKYTLPIPPVPRGIVRWLNP